MSHRRPEPALALCLAFAACGEAADAPRRLCEVTPSLEVGTGRDAFEPMDATTRVPVIVELGTGNGAPAHVFVSLRTRGLEPERVEVESVLERADSGAPISRQRYRVAFPCDDCGCEYAGMRQFIDDAGLALSLDGVPLRLVVRATDARGASAGASRSFIASVE